MRATPTKITGMVCDVAHGTARVRNEKIAELLVDSLPDLEDFNLGTLNIRVTSPPALKIAKLTSPARTVVAVPKTEYSWRKRPLKAEKIAFLPVLFSIEGKVPEERGFLYVASRSSRSRKGILELMARENLRERYGVAEGDMVTIEIIDESG